MSFPAQTPDNLPALLLLDNLPGWLFWCAALGARSAATTAANILPVCSTMSCACASTVAARMCCACSVMVRACDAIASVAVSYTHLRAHETLMNL
eukprot:5742140-Prymnesium_polylepis.1